ncbi:hypothetical protein D9M72_547320 [compost metagenome]
MQANVAAHGLVEAGGQQVDAAALAHAIGGHHHIEAGFPQQAAHADGLGDAAADAVQQGQLAVELAGVGAQPLQQGFVVAGGDVFGNLHGENPARLGVLHGLDFHLGEGGCRAEGGEAEDGSPDCGTAHGAGSYWGRVGDGRKRYRKRVPSLHMA